MGLTEPGTKNDCAGKCQQPFTRNRILRTEGSMTKNRFAGYKVLDIYAQVNEIGYGREF
jgi:hypothetical protein